MSERTTPKRAERAARLRWIPIPEMRVSPLAQRDLNSARVDRLAADFDLEQIGTPTVSERDGHYYVIDGQHRIEALKAIGYGDQQIHCFCYTGLTEQEEAEKFLRLNDTLSVHAFSKFKVAVQAGRADECDIDRIVRAHRMVISQDDVPGSIRAVGTLKRVYSRSGAEVLARTLQIIRDAYGDPGLEAPVIDGIGHLCGRYNGELEDGIAIKKLGDTHGGVNGLLNKAEKVRREIGGTKAQCVAAAAVEIINVGAPRTKKLPSWWAS